jgi:branched-chain amino acid transport system ATP-binding protein
MKFRKVGEHSMILELENIVKRFGGLIAINDVSFQVEEGKILGLIGPNGAGKTTLINVISGVYKPEQGSVKMRGKNIVGLAPYRLCQMGISRTFQIVHSFPQMTVLENVMVPVIFGSGNKNYEQVKKKAREVLKFVQFPLPEDTPAKNLNTVTLKRLDLARALASNCKILLLDELASGLTPTELNDMIDLIKKIRDTGVTIITIEHVLKFIMQICDQIVVLHYGKKIAQGSCEEIVNDNNVRMAYLGEKYLL